MCNKTVKLNSENWKTKKTKSYRIGYRSQPFKFNLFKKLKLENNCLILQWRHQKEFSQNFISKTMANKDRALLNVYLYTFKVDGSSEKLLHISSIAKSQSYCKK